MTLANSFDFETTGLVVNRLRSLDKQPWAVELYIEQIDVENAKKVKEFQSHFRPGVKLEKEAAKVTGLTDEFLSNKPLFSAKIDEIEQIFVKEGDILLGQNIMFDLTIMAFEFKRCGRVLDLSGKRLIDTVEQTSYIFGYRAKLGDMYEHFFNRRFLDSHTASADAIATTEIFLHLVKQGDIEIG